MNGFLLAIGKQGSGKTAFITKLIVDNKGNRPIFGNYTLFDIPFQKITLGNEEEKKKGAIDILEMLETNPNFFNNSIMALDEIHLYLDSLDFYKTNNRKLQTFFSQLRKRNILLLATTQYIMNVDIRIRRQCMNVFELKKLYKSIFSVTTYEIDGYYTEFVSNYKRDLSNYFQYFDTNEVIS
jgi:hypothetical protein